VRSMSIRYASLQCNSRGRWGTRLTPVPTSRVSGTPLQDARLLSAGCPAYQPAHDSPAHPGWPLSSGRLSACPPTPTIPAAQARQGGSTRPRQGLPNAAPLAARGGRRNGQPICGLPPAHAALPRHRVLGTGRVCLVMRRGAGRETLRGLGRETLRGLGRNRTWFEEKPHVV